MKIKAIAANQSEVHQDNDTIVFLSYSTPVAAFIPGTGIVKTEKKWSATTSKHINAFIQRTNPASTVTEKPQSFFDSLV
jgi:hypothetical protein